MNQKELVKKAKSPSFLKSTRLRLLILLIFLPVACTFASLSHSSDDVSQLATNEGELDGQLAAVADWFTKQYVQLRIPAVELDYLQNLKKISKPEDLARQEALFLETKVKLSPIDERRLSLQSRIILSWLTYVVDESLERLYLEKDFLEKPSLKFPDRLFQLADHEKWYAFYARRFASRKVSADEIIEIGKKQIEVAAEQLHSFQEQLGYKLKDTEFHAYLKSDKAQLLNLSDVAKAYDQVSTVARKNLSHQFYESDLDNLVIAPVVKANKDTPPGLYTRRTKSFNFSFFSEKHSKRSVDWLFLHEAIPGHHFQYQQEDLSKNRPAFAPYFKNFGFVEGWGAYAETLGKELGLYTEAESLYGRWEWDLVRAVRVVLDVRINHDGWDREKALLFWKEHVKGQDDIAVREIDRIIRWPGQVLSYKLGEIEFVAMKSAYQQCLGGRFDVRKFHQVMLERGNIPFQVLWLIADNELQTLGCKR